jgi:hypothetical protein
MTTGYLSRTNYLNYFSVICVFKVDGIGSAANFTAIFKLLKNIMTK